MAVRKKKQRLRLAPLVGVVTLQPQAYTLTSELPGRTTAFRVAEVRPQVNGIILKRLFKEGSDVKEGQQLYQIDPAVYEANLANAQANLQATRSLAERYKQLIDEQAVSKQEYDDANAKRLQAEASLKAPRSICATPRFWRRSAVVSGARPSPKVPW